MAVRFPDSRLGLSTTRRERFTAEIWLRRHGQAESLAWAEAPGATLSCDTVGCIYRVAGQTVALVQHGRALADDRSEEHTSELQSLMRISYAVFCLKKQKTTPI